MTEWREEGERKGKGKTSKKAPAKDLGEQVQGCKRHHRRRKQTGRNKARQETEAEGPTVGRVGTATEKAQRSRYKPARYKRVKDRPGKYRINQSKSKSGKSKQGYKADKEQQKGPGRTRPTN